jgi:hypothetical protein
MSSSVKFHFKWFSPRFKSSHSFSRPSSSIANETVGHTSMVEPQHGEVSLSFRVFINLESSVNESEFELIFDRCEKVKDTQANISENLLAFRNGWHSSLLSTDNDLFRIR